MWYAFTNPMRRASCLALLLALRVFAQPAEPVKELRWRLIGPFRGGRAVTVAGVNSQPNVYYFGATGGGVFKTTDGGFHWEPITDGQVGTGSVGSIAVSESDPNVIYVGMGEPCIRGNASHGDGVYKSTDAGKTWKHIGLEDSYHIGAVRVHPKNPDIVWVAALGHLWGSNEQRGIFKSVDGGKTWKQVLTRGPKAGAVDIAVDPNNASILYAGFWEVSRQAWNLESGGPGSGIFKSTDGGDTWTDITKNPGLPKGVLGRIGITVSGANSDRVWAIVEAEEGGVFRSDNAGKTWTRVNEQRALRQRAWYYTHIFADPQKADTVYVLNTGFYRSNDGGRTYTPIQVPHGDNHGLWIAPGDPNRMIECNDGGANVTTNGGHSWTSEDNQPTSQFYRVALDNDFPYHVYGAQQDNTTVKIASRGPGGITEREWHPVGGGESGWIAADPRDTNIVYAGSYDGLLTRYDHRTGQSRNITVWPDNPMGAGAEAMKYRFQWNFPLFISPHDPQALYAGGNMVFKSTDEGHSWTAISGDLTRNDKSKMGPSGGPITKDNTSIEYYCTIFTMAESTLQKGLIWVGSDDGLVHVTRDGGKTWSNVTPKEMPEWIRINSIEPSPNEPGTAYIAATMYQFDDFGPYLYKTEDYGKTWKKIVNGISPKAFTRVVREDPNHKGGLVAGTELGLYVSYDGGANWSVLKSNVPVVPITDLAFHKRDNELVAATQGRAFWILDDLPMLWEMNPALAKNDVQLYRPKDIYRMAGGGGFGGLRSMAPIGQNPPPGVVIYYSLKAKPKEEATIEILDESGKLVRKFSSKAERGEGRTPVLDDDEDGPPRPMGPRAIPTEAGLNRFMWDLRYPDATTFPGLIMWAGGVRGPVAIPGKYQVRLAVAGQSQTQPFEVKKDPRIKSTIDDLNKQLQLSLQLRDKLSQTNEGVIRIREAKKQLDDYAARWKDEADAKAVVEAAKALNKKLSAIEQELYQVKNQSNQDPLNFPIKLNNKIAGVMGTVQESDTAPTVQSNMVFEDLATQVNAQLKLLDQALSTDLAAFNKLVKDKNLPAVRLAAPAKQ